jgi:hypothetical protein
VCLYYEIARQKLRKGAGEIKYSCKSFIAATITVKGIMSSEEKLPHYTP